MSPPEEPRPGKRVVVVERDADMLDLLVEVLTLEGYLAEGMAEVERALDGLTAARPDLLVVDVGFRQFGDVTGWDLVRLVRGHPDLRGVPILVTSPDLRQLRQRTPEAAAMDRVLLLAKPFELETLMAMVQLATADPVAPGRSAQRPSFPHIRS